MRPEVVFDICLKRYSALRGWLDERASGVPGLSRSGPSSGYRWHPMRAGAADYVSDFERITRNALRRPEWIGRRRLLEQYFLAGNSYRRALVLVAVATGTFDWWAREVRKTAGAALLRKGLFPPSKYFRGDSLTANTSASSIRFGHVRQKKK